MRQHHGLRKAGQAGFPITMQPRCPQQQQILSGPEFLNPNILNERSIEKLHQITSTRGECNDRHAYKLRAVSGVAALSLSTPDARLAPHSCTQPHTKTRPSSAAWACAWALGLDSWWDVWKSDGEEGHVALQYNRY
jgi:hypothetical protein